VFDVETQFVGHRGKASLQDLCEILKIPAPFTDLSAASNADAYVPETDNRTLLLRSADVVRAVRSAHHIITGTEPLDSDIVMLGGTPSIVSDDEENDDPTDVPAIRFDPDEADAMDGEPVDETDLDQDVEPTIDDAEAA
jgi:hypothetical protein